MRIKGAQAYDSDFKMGNVVWKNYLNVDWTYKCFMNIFFFDPVFLFHPIGIRTRFYPGTNICFVDWTFVNKFSYRIILESVWFIKHDLPEFERLFPMACNIALCSGLHSSSSTDRTRDTWAPKFLCIPEHSMHISIPRLSEAHTGFGMWQSHFQVTKLSSTL